VLAAKRAGIRTILLPRLNEKDLKEVPRLHREGLKLIPLSKVDDVFRIALES
jgi:ATP-dependent Lon protease